MFTSEPSYSEGPFRVTKISASFGHGEGVVKKAEVATDTIYLTTSHKGASVELYHNVEKERRLGPVQRNDKVELQVLNNPAQLLQQRALDKKMTQRLHQLAIYIEKRLGKPMDLELVIQGNKIYLVQLRPIVRAEIAPTYFDTEAFNKVSAVRAAQATPIETAKVLVSGNGSVLKVRQHNILFCQNLEEAQRLFNKNYHHLVVVKEDETTENSHPIVNFASRGIVCLFLPHALPQADSWFICPQTGNIIPKTPDSDVFIKKGYTSHPAPLRLSFDAPFNPIKKSAEDKELKALIETLKAATINDISLPIIRKLKSYPEQLDKEVQALGKDSPIIIISDELKKRWLATLDEIEHSKERLQRLYHIKTLEQLASQPYSGLATYSLLQVAAEVKKIKFQRENDIFRLGEFIEVGKAFGFTEGDEKKWIEFLQDLEKSSSPADLIEFKNILNILSECQALQAWFITFFLPNSHKKASEICQITLQQITNENRAFLSKLNRVHKELEQLKSNLNDFSNPNKTESAFKHLLELHEFFMHKDLLALKEFPLMRTLILGEMLLFVDLFDSAIKMYLVKNPSSTIDKQIQIRRVFKETTQVLKTWITGFIDIKEMPHASLDQFFKMVDQAFKDCHNLDSNSSFDVSGTLFYIGQGYNRVKIQSLDHLFTLLHQNLLGVISYCQSKNFCPAYLPENAKNTFNLVSQASIQNGKYKYVFCGLEFKNKELKFHFNLSSSHSHSGRVILSCNPFTQECYFEGQTLNTGQCYRVDLIEEFIKGLHLANILHYIKIKKSEQSFYFTWKITSNEQLALAISLNLYLFEWTDIAIFKGNYSRCLQFLIDNISKNQIIKLGQALFRSYTKINSYKHRYYRWNAVFSIFFQSPEGIEELKRISSLPYSEQQQLFLLIHNHDNIPIFKELIIVFVNIIKNAPLNLKLQYFQDLRYLSEIHDIILETAINGDLTTSLKCYHYLLPFCNANTPFIDLPKNPYLDLVEKFVVNLFKDPPKTYELHLTFLFKSLLRYRRCVKEAKIHYHQWRKEIESELFTKYFNWDITDTEEEIAKDQQQQVATT